MAPFLQWETGFGSCNAPPAIKVKDTPGHFSHLLLPPSFSLSLSLFHLSHFHVPPQQIRHVSLVQGSSSGGTPYALLGWCIIVEQAVSLLMLGSKVVKLRQRAAREERVALEGGEGEANVNEVEQGGKCMLCLEMRRATTATSCGMQSPMFMFMHPPPASPPPHLKMLFASLSSSIQLFSTLRLPHYDRIFLFHRDRTFSFL